MIAKKNPQVKFYKDAVSDILSGKKTLEPRPRNPRWIERIEKADLINLTYGPRFGAPTIFATAKVEKVEVRPFSTTTKKDLQKIGLGWQDKQVKEFVDEYNRWFAKDLEKGYPVAWVYFSVMKKYE